jgi:hypothetical protein
MRLAFLSSIGANFSCLVPQRPSNLDRCCKKAGRYLALISKNAVAIFLDVGKDCELSAAPFCYDEQFKRANRISVVGLAQFVELAADIKSNQKLVHLYSMGHCGSTLLHNVFNKVPDVGSISEPKVFFDLAIARRDLDPDLMLQLACAALKFISLFPAASQAKTLVLKHFSQVNTILPIMQQAAPQARNVFLYRDGNSWTNSFYGYAQRRAGVKLEIPKDNRDFSWYVISGNAPSSELEDLVDLHADTVTFDSLVAVAWALHVRDYLEARNAKMKFFAVRYNELEQNRVTVIKQILQACDLNADFAEATLSAFDTDSHQGTKTTRDIAVEKLDSESYRRIANILANPRVNFDPDLMLPNSP